MEWDLEYSENNHLLKVEMNSTDINGGVEGDVNTAGSVQLVFSVPDFKDSLVYERITSKTPRVHVIDNFGKVYSVKGLKGKFTVRKRDDKIFIDGNLELISSSKKQKQQIRFNNNSIPIYDLEAFSKLEKGKREAKDKMVNDFAAAIASAIIKRDSIWEEQEKLIQDSLDLHPYTGPFRFWISQVFKAAYSRVTFFISEDSVIIKKGPYDFIYLAKDYSKDSIYFRKALNKTQRDQLKALGEFLQKDTLRNFYDNRCIIDGLILCFSMEWAGKDQSITVANYYEEKIATILKWVNGVIPSRYRIYYDKPSLTKMMKNCE